MMQTDSGPEIYDNFLYIRKKMAFGGRFWPMFVIKNGDNCGQETCYGSLELQIPDYCG